MKIYTVDAFTDRLFSGNPAAVYPLEQWPDDAFMQSVAFENNLAETAFFVPDGDNYHIRWFTPVVEVDLCGHATLAAAHVLFNHIGYQGNKLKFKSRSGILTVTKNGNQLTLDFPADKLNPVELTPELSNCFSVKPIAVYIGKTDYMFVFPSQKDIETIIPDLAAIKQLTKVRGIIITAPGNEVDFVSRFFAPQSGIDEDPVTGSAHTSLTPYWAEQMNKNKFTCLQLSKRVGKLTCELAGERVKISGEAVTYLIGNIQIN